MSIEVKNLFKYYGEQAAVCDISFSVKKGEIVGFLGPNGAGKSTTMKIMTGFIPASSGEIHICGMKVDVDNLKTRQIIGYLPENNPLYTEMYVREYLEFVGRIYKIKNLKNRVSEMIQTLGLELEQNKKIGSLSKGLDPNQLVEIRELIRKIGEEKTVILSTHIMQEVEAICDRIVIISKGKIVANDKASILQNESTHQTVYVEFDSKVSKSQLIKIPNIQKVEALNNAWLIETSADIDLRKEISQFAQKEKWLILTLKIEKKSLEEVFKDLTK